MMLFFSIFMVIISSCTIIITRKIFKNVEIKWNMEVLTMIKMINYMTMILQMNGGAPRVCS